MTATSNLCKTLKHIKNFEHSTRTTTQSPNEAKHDFKNYSDHVILLQYLPNEMFNYTFRNIVI